MGEELRGVVREYRDVLREYLEGAGESALQRAYELARGAMGRGMGVLDMATAYHEALSGILRGSHDARDSGRILRSAGTVFVESLSPFEMMHRAFRESITTLRRMNDSFEEQAKRIGAQLHSEAGQLLTSVHIALVRISGDLPPDARARLAEVHDLLDQAEQQIRRLSHELRPSILDDLGLLPALGFLTDGVAARTGIQVTVTGRMNGRLPPRLETGLYRIVQEALNNVARHAHATRASVTLEADRRLVRCVVSDDGAGFDAARQAARRGARGLGLVAIRERLSALGGSIDIVTGAGKGTQLSVTIPVED